MLGAIIGDIVGSRFEFNPTNDYNFKLFDDKCSFTDDTICTIAIADALLTGRDYGESLHEWCRRYSHPMGGYGGRFREWILSDNPQPYGSFGNGSAMRVSPIGWWFDSLRAVAEEAKKTAECTHNHPMGIEGAEAVALAIKECHMLRLSKRGKRLTPEVILSEGLYHAVGKYVSDPHLFDIDIEKYRNVFDETCQGTVPVALWIVMHSTGFEDALRRAVSLGADADTLGAIVGSIAEALWGIPGWMKAKAMTYLPDEMKRVINEFHHRVIRRREQSARSRNHKTDRPVSDDEEAKKEKEKESLANKALMLWKFGAGNMGKYFNGEDPMPAKTVVATKDSLHNIEPWPDDPKEIHVVELNIEVPEEAMDQLKRGHIPDAMEDHWFMYADDEFIRYYRSWTGLPVFEAHYTRCDDGYLIDVLRINKSVCYFNSKNDLPEITLFIYLIVCDGGGDSRAAWEQFMKSSGF